MNHAEDAFFSPGLPESIPRVVQAYWSGEMMHGGCGFYQARVWFCRALLAEIRHRFQDETAGFPAEELCPARQAMFSALLMLVPDFDRAHGDILLLDYDMLDLAGFLVSVCSDASICEKIKMTTLLRMCLERAWREQPLEKLRLLFHRIAYPYLMEFVMDSDGLGHVEALQFFLTLAELDVYEECDKVAFDWIWEEMEDCSPAYLNLLALLREYWSKPSEESLRESPSGAGDGTPITWSNTLTSAFLDEWEEMDDWDPQPPCLVL
jgi:hypothetical protein